MKVSPTTPHLPGVSWLWALLPPAPILFSLSQHHTAT